MLHVRFAGTKRKQGSRLSREPCFFDNGRRGIRTPDTRIFWAVAVISPVFTNVRLSMEIVDIGHKKLCPHVAIVHPIPPMFTLFGGKIGGIFQSTQTRLTRRGTSGTEPPGVFVFVFGID